MYKKQGLWLLVDKFLNHLKLYLGLLDKAATPGFMQRVLTSDSRADSALDSETSHSPDIEKPKAFNDFTCTFKFVNVSKCLHHRKCKAKLHSTLQACMVVPEVQSCNCWHLTHNLGWCSSLTCFCLMIWVLSQGARHLRLLDTCRTCLNALENQCIGAWKLTLSSSLQRHIYQYPCTEKWRWVAFE